MDLARQLAAIDALRARPAPGVVDLCVGEGFWDDPAGVAQAREQVESECQSLVDRLTDRWGEAETLDLNALLERLAGGEAVPPPLDTLCGYVDEVYRWRVNGRWIAVGVGHQGPELPFQLTAAVGDAEVMGQG
jgi:hypothetical protein